MAMTGPRALKGNELRSAVELADRVFRIGWGSSMQDDYGLLLARDNLENLRVFLDGDNVVSLVGMFVRDIHLLGSRHLSCCIGAVCTDPAYRNQGLATQLMEDARKKALSDGVDVFLISGGRGLYRRLGYVNVGTYYACTVSRKSLPSSGAYTVRPWQPEDVPALVRIHSAEPVRFSRTPEDFLGFLNCGKVVNVNGSTAVICLRDRKEPVAYLAYQVGGNPGEKKDPNAVTIAEVAGPRWTVLCGLGALLRERGVEHASLDYVGCDSEMSELVRSFGWPSEPREFHGTVGIIDPPSFWQACVSLFTERLGPERAKRLSFSGNRQVTITYAGESLTLDSMSEFTNLVFLPPHRRHELSLGLPADSQLARVLDDLFPLPLVDYGLNYI